MLYLNNVFARRNHKTRVYVIGCGGTGSNILPELSALSFAFEEMDIPGFKIHVFDDDFVELKNIGRQKFYNEDLLKYKCDVLAERINYSYGDNIKAYPELYSFEKIDDVVIRPTLIISCVDNVKTRRQINKDLKKMGEHIIWIDIGNDANSGQFIVKLIDSTGKKTQSCVDVFPKMRDLKTQPSCSMAESLKEQNFTINKVMANFVVKWISEFFMNKQIPYSQLYYNGDKMKITTA